MANKKKNPAPWENEKGSQWLASFDPWYQTLRLVEGTLQLEAHKNPQEIRAAAAMVLLFCREDLWPHKSNIEREQLLELAARQLSTIKQLYEKKSRENSALLSNRNYRNLLKSIDQEIRILEARMSAPPSMPNEPPCTWGTFWF